uniref:Uncharacterized protein n=1 Tax=Tanacetum cinerariifolium TaxID=118510 RepID=A0A699HNQ8_TANCI|nr:hypothetical protein [Tanacetum cinerariifolium]
MVAARFTIVHAPASNDRELPNTASKNGGHVGPTNHKRTLSASSSPPVTQRADQRPQKITYRQKNQYCPERGVATAWFSVPVGIPKHPSTAKASFDKPKSGRSKPARPHTRRPSYHKANSRQEPTIVGPTVCSLFRRQIEPLFSFPSDTDICYLKQHGSIQSVVPTTKPNFDSFRDILLCQRILSALILEKGEDNENDDTESNGYGSTFEDETSLKSNGFMEFRGVGPFYGYGKNSARGFHNEPVCSISDYQTMSMDNKLLMEIQSIRLCPELMVGAIFSNTLVGSVMVQKVDDKIDGLISDLENKYHEQVSSKTSVLDKLLKTATEAKTLQEKKSSFTDNESGQRCPQLIPFGEAISNGAKGKRSISLILNVEDDEPPLDFSHLEIPEMDVLGDAFGEQSLDVGSWLNIDDTILHDDDFIGHQIPIDDLSDIKMNV